MSAVEVRGFGDLSRLFTERGWPFPLLVELPEAIKASELALRLDIPREKIEIVFINGRAQSMEHMVAPGDRVAFVPPGTPGPYRVILGFVQKSGER